MFKSKAPFEPASLYVEANEVFRFNGNSPVDSYALDNSKLILIVTQRHHILMWELFNRVALDESDWSSSFGFHIACHILD